VRQPLICQQRPTKQVRESNASQPPGHSGRVQQGSVGNPATRQTARNDKQSRSSRANHPHATHCHPPHKNSHKVYSSANAHTTCVERSRRTLAHTHTPCSFALCSAPYEPRAISGPSSSWPVENTKARGGGRCFGPWVRGRVASLRGRVASLRGTLHRRRVVSRRIASHRIASHRIASHRIGARSARRCVGAWVRHVAASVRRWVACRVGAWVHRVIALTRRWARWCVGASRRCRARWFVGASSRWERRSVGAARGCVGASRRYVGVLHRDACVSRHVHSLVGMSGGRARDADCRVAGATNAVRDPLICAWCCFARVPCVTGASSSPP
jgi:hypothetical protein